MGWFTNVRAVFGNRNYRIYTAGNIISLIGTWMQRVAVQWLAWELTHSGIWLGLIAAADLLPTLVVSPLAGTLADRVDRVRVIRVTQIVAMVQAWVLAALTFSGVITITLLLILTLALGTANAINQPARLALIPSLIDRRNLSIAIGVNSLAFNAARFIGPAAAGSVIHFSGVTLAFVLNALTYVSFLLALSRLSLQPEELPPPRPMLGLALEGYAYALRHRGIGAMLIVFAVSSFGVRGFVELFPGFADRVFGHGAEGFAWLTATLGAGAVAGGLYMVSRRKAGGLTRVFIFNSLLVPASVLGFTLTDHYGLALLPVFIAGFSMIATGIAAQTLVQNATHPAMRGRVMGLYGMLFRAGPAFNAMAMGWLSSFWGLQLPVALGAGLCLLFWVWARSRQGFIEEALEREVPS
ncbi:MAG TPA: MFS transporter [Stellaceae bacterium]|nr:MFS transporter [Stellaceae bacterium]